MSLLKEVVWLFIECSYTFTRFSHEDIFIGTGLLSYAHELTMQRILMFQCDDKYIPFKNIMIFC